MINNMFPMLFKEVKPKVSIVMLNYEGRRYLGQLLDKSIESALSQTYTNIEVLFVDNGSSDNSIEYVVENYGNKVKLVMLDRNYGFCLGNNLASRYVSSDVKYILFMNLDSVLTQNYVERLIHFMEKYEWVGAAQGLQKGLEGSFCGIGGYIDSFGRGVEVDVGGLEDEIQALDRVFFLAWVSGSAMIVRKELFVRLGGFSPELFMYYDEIDLCARMLFLGFNTACYPQAVYYHRRGQYTANSKNINWFTWYFGNRNKWLTTLRYLPLRYVMSSFLLYLPKDILINIFKSFVKGERIRTRLIIRITGYVISNLKRELIIREVWASKHNLLANYIIEPSDPFFRKGLDRIAIKRALFLSRNSHRLEL